MTLYREILSHIEAHNLDPYLSALHAVQDKRPGLALDLMEEFRQPFIDLFIIKLLNLEQLTSKHFECNESEVKITENGLRTFFSCYEEYMGFQDGDNPGLRKSIDDQIVSFKKSLLGESHYEHFLLEAEDIIKKEENNP